MAYHITSFNNTTGNYAATTNPAANRDNYQLQPNTIFPPNNAPEINKPSDRGFA